MPILSSRRSPKFAMELTIAELTNIPKLSGTAYVKWKIKDNGISGVTEKAKIHRYRSEWVYTAVESLKIGVNSKGQLQDKWLQFKVYFDNHAQHSHHHHHNHELRESQSANPISANVSLDQSPKKRSVSDPSKHSDHPPLGNDISYVGRLKINLSEFSNFADKAVSRRYLLEDCKVNCILNIELSLRLISGDPTSFTLPPVKHRGLSSMFGTSDQSQSASQSVADTNTHEQSLAFSGSTYYQKLAIHSDPVLMKYYQKTFEITWDNRPGEFAPYECIEDIFHGGDGWAKNEDGQRLLDLNRIDPSERSIRNLGSHRRNSEYSSSGSTCNGSSSGRERSGVGARDRYKEKEKNYSEFEVRGDIKSWQVSHIRD